MIELRRHEESTAEELQEFFGKWNTWARKRYIRREVAAAEAKRATTAE